MGFLRQLLFVTVLKWLWAVVARTHERAAGRLVLDKLINQQLGNFDPLRMVTASSNGWSYANQGSKNNFESVC